MVVYICIIAFLVVIGIIFATGKGSFLLIGYNCLPKERKEQLDKVLLCKFVSKLMFSVSFCVFLWFLDSFFPHNNLHYIGSLSLFVTIFLAFIYLNTGNRFKKKEEE